MNAIVDAVLLLSLTAAPVLTICAVYLIRAWKS